MLPDNFCSLQSDEVGISSVVSKNYLFIVNEMSTSTIGFDFTSVEVMNYRGVCIYCLIL